MAKTPTPDMIRCLFILLAASCIFLGPGEALSQETIRPRTIVTTDGEVDDVDSFFRMLLYANAFRLEGLVYSSSQWHYKGDGKGTAFTSELENTAKGYGERTELRWPGTTWMQELLNEYEKVQLNLSLHADGSPELIRYQRVILNVRRAGEAFLPLCRQGWGNT